MSVINHRSKARLGRPPLFTTAVVGAILATGALVGCGSAAAPGAGGPGPTGQHARPAKATLTVTVTDKADGTVKHWTLRCDPVGGTAPDPAAACKTLFGAKHPFKPLPHVMCPMIMISGKQIIVDGTWFGQKVHRVIIDGGCDLPFFNSLDKTFN
jgi:hypothetical protein